MPLPEAINRLRRKGAQIADQLGALTYRQLFGVSTVPAETGAVHDPRFALLTVNFHTTSYLKMMLLGLLEQDDLARLVQLIIVDNGSQDGGQPFLRALAERSDKVLLIENRRWTNHARGMRLGLAALDKYDAEQPDTERANLLLFCDPDVLFLRDDTLNALAETFTDPEVSHAGELRTHLHPLPEAQASFLALRRDWAARRDISPWVNHGSPTWWLQRDLIKKGGKAAHFAANQSGYILHRGRTAVAATSIYAPLHSYASTRYREPHFMGVPEGAAAWASRESALQHWLESDRETALVEHLAARLS